MPEAAHQRQLNLLVASGWGSQPQHYDTDAIEEQRARIRAADYRVVKLQAQWANALERRIEMLGGPDRPVQVVRYTFWKWRMIELERALEGAKHDTELERGSLRMMLPWPHKPRRRARRAPKIQYVRENGIRVPRSKS